MTSSRIGLAILAAIAVALGVVHAAVGTGARTTSRAIFADSVETATTALAWQRAGAPPIAIGRQGDGWTMTSPSAGPVDPAAVADVLGALRGARWQRTTSTSPGPAMFTLSIGAASIEVGPEVPGVGGWLHRGARWYLVERWVIAALDRDALSLRPRTPLAAAARAVERIAAQGADLDVEFTGAPLAFVTPAGPVRLARDVASAVVGHLAGLHVERLVAGDRAPPAPELAIVVDGPGEPIALELRGACPGDPELAWIGGAATGEVCVAAAPILAFEAAARAIAADPLTYADPRIAPPPYEQVTLLSGATLAWHGATVVVDAQPTDAGAVARVVAALAALAELVPIGTPRPAATGSITIDGRTLELVGADTLAPPDSGYGYRVSREALAALRLAPDQLRDRVVLRTEPSLLTGLAITDASGTHDVPLDDPWAEAVGEAVREVRADSFATSPLPTARRTIQLTYAPPPSAGAAPETHRIDLGPAMKTGCAAVVDGEAVVLPRALCGVLGKQRRP